MTFDLLQILLAAFGFSSLVFLARQRILLGCVFGLAAYGVWVQVAYAAGQPGALVFCIAMCLINALGVIGRIPRRRAPQDEDDTEITQTDGRRLRAMSEEE